MPCRQLIRGHPSFSQTDGQFPVDAGLSPFTQTPSPFALFSNRFNVKNVKANANTTRNKAGLKSGADCKPRCLEKLNIFILPHTSRRAIIPMSINRCGGLADRNENGDETDTRNGLLLMLASNRVQKHEDFIPRKSPFYEINSNFVKMEQDEESQPPPPPLEMVPDLISKVEPEPTCSNGTITTTDDDDKRLITTDYDLLPIKKRRLRQIMMQEQQELSLASSSRSSATATTTPMTFSGVTCQEVTSQCSTVKNNPPEQLPSSTTSGTIIPPPLLPSETTLSNSNSCSSATTIYLNGTPVIPIMSTLHQQRFSLPPTKPNEASNKRRPVYIGDRKSLTFIDIESQRWWDRAHLAYAFHPKKRKRKIIRKPDFDPNKPVVPPPQPDIYDSEDPRSQNFQEWLTSFYPEQDFSSSTFIQIPTTSEEETEPKNLLEKLGLVNPLEFPRNRDHDQNQNNTFSSPSRNNLEGSSPTPPPARLPPWVTEEGLRQFDITDLHADYRCPSGQQKFRYD
ncbi:uncharacterized protein LOC110855995 [Folsomia candida]|uniref:uncharacterized protein LOC110855995 n=1 Tax=Folsomia candida TaxID=158441 RepID=UPI000B8F96B1|nr:uncharacterized protein LOC110855995 [Folsomia candida]XP_021960128.1 uncharacterized protein LOC110855995 [Folsomia candida]XP_035712548.1 uncharacterized protein LOC110855995 [Folsomia candida]